MEFSYLRKCVDNDFTGVYYTGNYSEFLKALILSQERNLESSYGFLILGTYYNDSYGILEFFKGGANVSQST